jgi:superfamily II DNA/RNA helicase
MFHTTKQSLTVCFWQNVEVLQKMGKYTGITSECAVPVDVKQYVPISKRSPVSAQVVIGTPGTIRKWMENKKLGVSQIKILVFDEADHMLAEVDFILLIIFIFGEIESIVVTSFLYFVCIIYSLVCLRVGRFICLRLYG